MSPKVAEELRKRFGERRILLDVAEVAEVIGRVTRGTKGHIRERMKNGDIPGARKQGGRWKISIDDLAEVIDPTPAVSIPPLPGISAGGHGRVGRHRAKHGQRIQAMRTAQFWLGVCQRLGWEPEVGLFGVRFSALQNQGYEEAISVEQGRLDARTPSAQGKVKDIGHL
jgi:hypothetical protein